MGHPDVAEAAVIGVADAKWGERPVAYVVAHPGTTPTAETVRDHLRTRVASWWLPDQMFFLEEIPKTATGKFAKQHLRTLYVTENQ
jgi:fatty-acyl-CoA synthase